MKQTHILVMTVSLLTGSLAPAGADDGRSWFEPPPEDAPPETVPEQPPAEQAEPPPAQAPPEQAPPEQAPATPATPAPAPSEPPPPRAPAHAIAAPTPPLPSAPVDDKPPPPLAVHLFADGQYVWSTRRNNAVDAMGLPLPHPAHRAWERNNGFALSFLGIDSVYDTPAFAVTASLRFGSSVVPFYAASTTSTDLDGVATAFQAYGTWKASPKLAMDVGRFSTIYGAEVAESWKNLNYTRGALYYAFQPFWHTGVRATYQASSELKLTGMVVNGANNSVDAGNERPAIGVQAAYTTGMGSLLVGYLGSQDPDSDFFDQFLDVVATLNVGKLSLVFNADLIANRLPPSTLLSTLNDHTTNRYFGASAGAGYTLSDTFRIAGRGELLVDDDADTKVYTGTATLDYRPLGNANVVLRLDHRFESSDQKIFIDRDAAPTKRFFQAVVGIVVTSN